MATVIVALIFFSVLIVVHELGHYLSARMVGIKAEEFSIGMGPAIFKFTGENTTFCLRVLPIGGYVKFNEDMKSADPQAFTNAKLWKRMLVIVSGSAMNFLLAVVLLSVFFSAFGVYERVPVIYSVEEGSPAYQVGIVPGDVIVRVSDFIVDHDLPDQSLDEIRQIVTETGSQPINFAIERAGTLTEFDITPMRDPETGNYRIGVVFGRTSKLALGESIVLAFKQTGRIIYMMIDMLGNMITRGEGIGDVMGPVGIVGEIGRAVEYGIERIMNLAIIISINLGIINLVPFPALDGGRLVIMIVEGIRGKAIDPQKEGYIHLVGFAILMALMLLITFRDIVR